MRSRPQLAEIVEVGDLLFSRGEPSDPDPQRRYQLYTRVKAAANGAGACGGLAGGESRLEALRVREIVVEELEDVGVAVLVVVEVFETEVGFQMAARSCKTLYAILDAVSQGGERVAVA